VTGAGRRRSAAKAGLMETAATAMAVVARSTLIIGMPLMLLHDLLITPRVRISCCNESTSREIEPTKVPSQSN
jgi:hypothetical protein